MNVAPMKVNWSFDTANLQDDFFLFQGKLMIYQPKVLTLLLRPILIKSRREYSRSAI